MAPECFQNDAAITPKAVSAAAYTAIEHVPVVVIHIMVSTAACRGRKCKSASAQWMCCILTSIPCTLPMPQDVYSWAMIMCEMLSGQLPWLGCNNMAIICNVAFKHERPELPGEDNKRELEQCQPVSTGCAAAQLVAALAPCFDSTAAVKASGPNQ
jgi:hypothetical protein